MASITASLPPSLLLQGKRTFIRSPQKLLFSPTQEKRPHFVVIKATGESSESSTSLDIVKSVQNVWDNSEDRFGLIGLGFAAVVGFWASANLIAAVDKLPVIPSVLELVGILFSAWFTYRYLLFRPNREELFQIISKTFSDILGQ